MILLIENFIKESYRYCFGYKNILAFKYQVSLMQSYKELA